MNWPEAWPLLPFQAVSLLATAPTATPAQACTATGMPRTSNSECPSDGVSVINVEAPQVAEHSTSQNLFQTTSLALTGHNIIHPESAGKAVQYRLVRPPQAFCASVRKPMMSTSQSTQDPNAECSQKSQEIAS